MRARSAATPEKESPVSSEAFAKACGEMSPVPARSFERRNPRASRTLPAGALTAPLPFLEELLESLERRPDEVRSHAFTLRRFFPCACPRQLLRSPQPWRAYYLA